MLLGPGASRLRQGTYLFGVATLILFVAACATDLVGSVLIRHLLFPLSGWESLAAPSTVGFWVYLAAVLCILLCWGMSALDHLRRRRWTWAVGTLLLPVAGALLGVLMLATDVGVNSELWSRITGLLRQPAEGLLGGTVFGWAVPTLLLLWLSTLLYVVAVRDRVARGVLTARQEHAFWGTRLRTASQVLAFAVLAIGIAILSEQHQRVGPFQGTKGNMCGPAGQYIPCVTPVVGAGFPLPYLLDDPNFSVVNSPHYGEDEFEVPLFLADVGCYGLLVWGMARGIQRVARVAGRPDTQSSVQV
jgi:hypothetical protein